ncbi:hypothetical protein PR048_028445 [Dryococelus australis]|uniref:Uncharacterized protein n=1 Tax=Dryococelus australis TaxID=614101 RepID=A0ABQ9GAJ9_9NEOP|nr:hypothetical protein PR048_028445 [Dryococelus australis]
MSSDSNVGDLSLLSETLQCFLEKVVTTRAKSDVSVNCKRAVIGQSLVSACRSCSFISPILLGIVIIHEESKGVHMNQGDYCQYAFNNADFYVLTLTGHGTFHSMGGLRFITPAPGKSADSLLCILDAQTAVSIT